MEKYIDDSHIHEGHRGRMRAKLLSHGQRIFDTYELLEMLLYQVIPCKDTNPIAKRLLSAFGSLDGVLTSDKESLMGVSGVGERAAEFLISVGKLGDIIGAELLPRQTADFSNYETVGEFFVDYFSDIEERCVVALFLDNNMRPIEFKRLYNIEYESGGVKAKPFIDAALKNHASVIISAHNHPFGPFFPTQGDRATNSAITTAISMVGLLHAEHYIVCGRSYAGIGSIKDFTTRVFQTPALNDFLKGVQHAYTHNGGLRSSVMDRCSRGTVLAPCYNTADLDYFASLLSVISRSDADEVAKGLLIRYQTIENVITAHSAEVAEVSSEKHAFFLKLLAYITSRRVTDGFAAGKKYSQAQLAEYLKALYIGVSVEQAYLICFDRAERFICSIMLGEGTVNSSELIPRKAIENAVAKSACSVAIAHNHPFGNTTPSVDDVKSTNMLERLFRGCEIGFLGHYIVAGQRCEIIPPTEISHAEM